MSTRFTLGLIVASILIGLPTHAAAAPQTQPAPVNEPAGRRGEMLLQRIHDVVVNDVGITDEQKSKMEEVFKQAREDMQTLSAELRDLGPQERGQRFREFMTELRPKIQNLLTEEQTAKMEETLQQMRTQLQA